MYGRGPVLFNDGFAVASKRILTECEVTLLTSEGRKVREAGKEFSRRLLALLAAYQRFATFPRPAQPFLPPHGEQIPCVRDQRHNHAPAGSRQPRRPRGSAGHTADCFDRNFRPDSDLI